MLDPRGRSHDWNALNNRENRAFKGRSERLIQVDNPTRETARRDRIVTSLLPLAWHNDYGGWTAALRSRQNYLGRFEKNLSLISYAFDQAATHRLGGYVRFGNPVNHPMPRTEASASFWSVEGRTGIALQADRSLKEHLAFGADRHAGFDAIWMAVTDLGYVDRRLWDDAGTVEVGPWGSITSHRGATVWHARASLRGGLLYRNPGIGVQSSNRYDFEGFGRVTGDVSVRTPFILKTTLGVRLFGGSYSAANAPPLQRRIMLAGADPYETFANPLLRSRGALLVRPDFHYQAPGDAILRGFRPDLGGRWAAAVNVEATKSLYRRPQETGLLTQAALEVFADGGVVDPRAVPPATAGQSYTSLYDAGVGLVTRHQINDLGWTMRFETPLLVNRWDYAAAGTDKRIAFRWLISLEPSF